MSDLNNGRERLARDLGLLFAPHEDRLITMSLLPLKGIVYNRNHLRRMWNEGKFPRPMKLSPRKLAWRESEIDAWIASRRPVSEGRSQA